MSSMSYPSRARESARIWWRPALDPCFPTDRRGVFSCAKECPTGPVPPGAVARKVPGIARRSASSSARMEPGEHLDHRALCVRIAVQNHDASPLDAHGAYKLRACRSARTPASGGVVDLLGDTLFASAKSVGTALAGAIHPSNDRFAGGSLPCSDHFDLFKAREKSLLETHLAARIEGCHNLRCPHHLHKPHLGPFYLALPS